MAQVSVNATPAANKSRGKILGVVGLVLVCGLGYFGFNWYTDQHNYVTTENAKVSGDIINASSKIPGKVVEIKVKNGSQVKKGDVLFVLDKDQLQAQTNQAQAALDVAKAQLAKVTSGARSEEVAATQAGVDQAQAAYNGAAAGKDSLSNTLNDLENQYNTIVAKLNGATDAASALQQLDAAYKVGQNLPATDPHHMSDAEYTIQAQGIQNLFAAKAQLETQINQLKGQLNTLNAQVSGAQAALNGAKSKLTMVNAGATDKDVAIIEAQVRAAQATFDLAQLNLGYGDVKAPVDGTVVQTNIHLGDNIAPGQAAISLVDFSKLQVTAYVLENDLERIQLNQPVKLTIDAFPGQTFDGTVSELGLATASTFNLFGGDNATGNFTKVSQRIPIKISFNGTTTTIPGMSVTAKIKVTK